MSTALNMQEIRRTSRDIIQGVEKEVETARKKVTLKLFSDLIKATPVDTGRARAGWMVSAGRPSNEAPPEGQQSYPEPDATNALVAFQDNEPFGVIWIVNNVSYIVALDEGHSGQAPAGMTSIALNNLRSA